MSVHFFGETALSDDIHTDIVQAPSVEDSAQPEGPTDAPRAPRESRMAVMGVVTLGVLVALLMIVCAVLGLKGYRVYVMETPSMGTAAPVGSLVAVQPVEMSHLERGDVVTVAPHGGGATHTHRVVEISAGTATTQGDLNGSPDPEIVDATNLVGRAVFIAPVLGWVVKMLPIILVTILVGFILTHWMRDQQAKFRHRVLSVFCGIALASVVVQPLLGVELLYMKLDTNADGPFAEAHVVSTGLLPVQVSPLEEGGQSSAALNPTGTAGSAVATQPSENGQFAFYPQMVVTPAWLIFMVLYCAAPFAVFGLHELVTRRKKRAA